MLEETFDSGLPNIIEQIDQQIDEKVRELNKQLDDTRPLADQTIIKEGNDGDNLMQ